jgi:hypothetical protein
MTVEIDRLLAWRSTAPDEFKLLIDELIETNKFLDVEREQKRILISTIERRDKEIESARKEKQDAYDVLLMMQDRIKQSSDAFQKLYSIAQYGNAIFTSLPLLKLWDEVEKMMNSTTSEEVSEGQSKVIVMLSGLSKDESLVDAKTSLLYYEKHVQKEDPTGFAEEK